jgi:DNA-binding LacI/PurR family transcriptional regulator
VVGFDGLAMGSYTVPKLASVSQDVEALALNSIRILRQNIEGNCTVCHEILPVSLRWNESAKFIEK